MAALIPNLVYSAEASKTVKMTLSKRKGDTVFDRAGRCAAEALVRYKQKHFAMRWGGSWQIYENNHTRPIREGLSEDAAAMWLLMRATR